MSHRRSPWALSAILVLTASAQADPPKPDFTDLPAYITALNRSTDPQAVAIRQEIADGPSALARERAAAQAAGIPLDASQFQRPLPPSNQNAAPLFQQLDALRRARPLGLPLYAQPLRSDYAYTPAQIAAVQQIVDSRRDVFDLLHKAADRPQCVFLRQWSLGPALDFPEFAGLREDARELNTESDLLARQGRYSDALADQSRGFRIAHDTTSDPILISYLVGGAIDAISLRGMTNILYQAGPNADVDAQVQKAVSADCLSLSLGTSLKGEVGFEGAALNLLTAHPANIAGALVPATAAMPPLPPTDIPFAANLLAAVQARYLSRMLPIIAAADQPGPARRALFASLSQPVGIDTSSQHSLDPVVELTDTLSLTDFTPIANKDDQIRTLTQVTMAAAAVLAVKVRIGTFPETLPGGFKDAFSGKPLGYRREGANGFVVYSVGAGGTFNGGVAGQYQFTPYQTFFRYPGPTPQPVPPDTQR